MKSVFGNVFILGDSYSTFEGYLPNGYPHYKTYHEKSDPSDGGINKVEKTWWYPLLKETNSNLIMNNSWSGSTVCHTGYNGELCLESSFIDRIRLHLKNGECRGEKIDTVFVFGGTNDSWLDCPIGQLKYDGWNEEDLKQFLPAFCLLLSYLTNDNKGLKIIVIINTDLKNQISNGIINACKHYGVKTVILNNIEKQHGHPNENGMKQIKDQILFENNKI